MNKRIKSIIKIKDGYKGNGDGSLIAKDGRQVVTNGAVLCVLEDHLDYCENTSTFDPTFVIDNAHKNNDVKIKLPLLNELNLIKHHLKALNLTVENTPLKIDENFYVNSKYLIYAINILPLSAAYRSNNVTYSIEPIYFCDNKKRNEVFVCPIRPYTVKQYVEVVDGKIIVREIQ